MVPDIQDVPIPNGHDLYAAPDVARLGTVEELTEGQVVAIQGDASSGPG